MPLKKVRSKRKGSGRKTLNDITDPMERLLLQIDIDGFLENPTENRLESLKKSLKFSGFDAESFIQDLHSRKGKVISIR